MGTLAAGRALGRYEIVRTIGSGGMGTVYEAKDTTLGRTVALKTLHTELTPDPESRRRLLLEASTQSRLRHPNLTTIFDVAVDDGVVYIVMEFVDGRPIDEALANARPPMTARQVLTALLPAFDAIAHAHKQGIIHRDIKPSNLRVEVDEDGRWGTVRIMDFGIASVQAPALAFERSRTMTGAIIGTPVYMAPEQFDGQASERSDVYQCGILLFELLAGFNPYGNLPTVEMFAAKRAALQFPDILPVQVRQLVARAAAYAAADRPASMAELIGEVRQVLLLPPPSLEMSVPVSASAPRLAPPPPSGPPPDTISSTPGPITALEQVAMPKGFVTALGDLQNREESSPALPRLESSTRFLGTEEGRLDQLKKVIEIYNGHLDQEYKQTRSHLESTHRMWLVTVAAMVVMVLAAVGFALFGRVDVGAVAIVCDAPLAGIALMFQKQAGEHRSRLERTQRSLGYGQDWVMALHSIDGLPPGEGRDTQIQRLVGVLLSRMSAHNAQGATQAG